MPLDRALDDSRAAMSMFNQASSSLSVLENCDPELKKVDGYGLKLLGAKIQWAERKADLKSKIGVLWAESSNFFGEERARGEFKKGGLDIDQFLKDF